MTRPLPAWVGTVSYLAVALLVGVTVGIVIAPMPKPLVIGYCPAPVLA